MYDNFKEKEQYSVLMDKLKLQNREYLQIKNAPFVQKAMLMERVGYSISHFDVGMAKRYLELKKQSAIIKKLEGKKNRIRSSEITSYPSDSISPNYFTEDNVVVYTVMFGNYDTIKEPVCVPDNVTFYIITDYPNHEIQSVWNVYNDDKFKKYTEKMDITTRSRWYKTHPHLLFPDYKYSLYVDSSVKIITDVTEHINKIGETGIAIHKHPTRNCVYDELDIVKIYKKDSKKNLKKIEELYKNKCFPMNYGLLENTVIASRHNDKKVIRIMEDWWRYIETCSRRDQLSLPVALYDNGVNIDECGLLGNNIKENYAFRVESHLGYYGRIKNKSI